MIPILYDKNTMDFSTNGIGRLSDAISCVVDLEANGEYELTMVYPLTGVHFSEIQMSSIIFAKPDNKRENQAFRVYKISKPLNGKVTVYAEHISYQLSQIPVSPFTAESAASALSGLKTNAAVDCPFEFWTDKTSSGKFAVEMPTSIRSKLGGSEGSILDVYGGEYDFDMYTVRLYNKLGQDNGVAIRYGKNLTDLTQEESIANTITGIMPYWADSEGTVIMLDEKVVESDASANYPYPRIAVMDFSSEFESQPTQQQLQQAAEDYIERNDIGVPSVSLSVSFAQLWQTEEYKDIAPLEEVAVFDTVTVQFDELGVDAKAKIRHTTYNVLLERYDSVEIGDARSNISTTLMEQQEKIDQAADPSFLIAAINNATNWITGGRGGYVIFQLNANGQPDEILILDTPSIETAQNVWRWNKGGFGHSKNGYDGPYETAITQDGKIVADFITAGSMLANIIKGGTLTMGGRDNGNGVVSVVDASGKEIVRLDNNGAKINNGALDITGVTNVTFAIRTKSANGYVSEVAPIGMTSYLPEERTFVSMESIGIFAGTYTGDSPLSGTTSPKAMIYPDGQIISMYAYNNTTSDGANVNVWANGLFRRAASSSRRYKKKITDQLPEKLNPDKLYDLPVRSFRYRKGYLEKGDRREKKDIIGLIVEELEEVYPIAVNYDEKGRPEMWNVQILLPAMLRLIQEQNERIKKLEGEA